MLSIDRFSQVPIYEQVISEIEHYVLLGLMAPGSLIPSVRSLSQELSINPNTLQKAYAELDRRGISKSVPGTGRFISENAIDILREESGSTLSDLSDTVKRLALSGVPYEKVLSIIKTAYETAQIKKGALIR